MAMEMMLRRMKIEDATVHGFRSSFRDWAGNETGYPRELIETALAHVIGDKAEQAYRRSDALEKRRDLMEAWAGYCEPKRTTNIVCNAAGLACPRLSPPQFRGGDDATTQTQIADFIKRACGTDFKTGAAFWARCEIANGQPISREIREEIIAATNDSSGSPAWRRRQRT